MNKDLFGPESSFDTDSAVFDPESGIDAYDVFVTESAADRCVYIAGSSLY